MSANDKHEVHITMDYIKPGGTVGSHSLVEYKDLDYADAVGIEEAVCLALIGLGKAAVGSGHGKK
jgi:hypothetical protein